MQESASARQVRELMASLEFEVTMDPTQRGLIQAELQEKARSIGFSGPVLYVPAGSGGWFVAKEESGLEEDQLLIKGPTRESAIATLAHESAHWKQSMTSRWGARMRNPTSKAGWWPILEIEADVMGVEIARGWGEEITFVVEQFGGPDVEEALSVWTGLIEDIRAKRRARRT